MSLIKNFDFDLAVCYHKMHYIMIAAMNLSLFFHQQKISVSVDRMRLNFCAHKSRPLSSIVTVDADWRVHFLNEIRSRSFDAGA